ncbi:MAG: MFS transporter [Sphingomonadaceae bacterium]|nr:MFS transporter [Sphingomonadaceae bacterium]
MTRGWIAGVRPYFERAPLAALLLGISSGFPYAMIGATLQTRLAESGINIKTVTAFSLATLLYSFKPIWAPVVDKVRLPVLARLLGQRRAWLLVAAIMVMASVAWLGAADPRVNLGATVAAAIAVGFSGATYDIVIDALRIESLSPRQLGAGSGMQGYGWRGGSAGAGALALFVAARAGWDAAYLATTLFALPALVAGLLVGEPTRHVVVVRRGLAALREAVIAPLADFARRDGAAIVLAFIMIHKMGDTIAQLSFRVLFNHLGYTKTEIATYDIGVGLIGYLVGLFVGGIVYARIGMKRAVLVGLVLIAVSNLSFSALAAFGNPATPAHLPFGLGGDLTVGELRLAAAIAFENFSGSVGDVAIVAYLSALCDLRFTATQFALLSSARAILGRFVTGTAAGALIERVGYAEFYLLTPLITVAGIGLYLYMLRRGLVAVPPRHDDPVTE